MISDNNDKKMGCTSAVAGFRSHLLNPSPSITPAAFSVSPSSSSFSRSLLITFLSSSCVTLLSIVFFFLPPLSCRCL